jgi:uncharacterized protein (TIGR01777 family)
MRIAITGASGFVGSTAADELARAGHEVVRLVRGAAPAKDTARWDPATGELDPALGEIDAVVHLAGENIAAGRWNAARKRAIADSRGPATERLCRHLAALPKRPRVLVSASATGIYGDRGDEQLDEASSPGATFLAAVARAWEDGTAPARDAGIRVVNLRIGMVLHPAGGALGKMLAPFRLGLGGRLGSGRQWISWITRTDLARAIAFVLRHEALSGPVLATSPLPVTNQQFTKALGGALGRPTVLPAPAFALRLLLGEMADALLLSSQRCRPSRLLEAGFTFEHPELDAALRAMVPK